MTQQNDGYLGELETRISNLEQAYAMHRHDGVSASRINLADILGTIEVVSTAPSYTPRDMYDQVKLYINSTTYRLYIYDNVNHNWHYVALT